MILEEETFEAFGYYPTGFKPQSNKPFLAACEFCGEIRITSKNTYRTFCHPCSQRLSSKKEGENNPMFGKRGAECSNWHGGQLERICETCGNVFYVDRWIVEKRNGPRGGHAGKYCSITCMAEGYKGKFVGGKSGTWQGGISFEPYCVKFNNMFKNYIRTKFNNKCFLCGKSTKTNSRKLDVHHVNYNKDCGCDGDLTCQFVPLCRCCHTKTNTNRDYWKKKIMCKLHNSIIGWSV